MPSSIDTSTAPYYSTTPFHRRYAYPYGAAWPFTIGAPELRGARLGAEREWCWALWSGIRCACSALNLRELGGATTVDDARDDERDEHDDGVVAGVRDARFEEVRSGGVSWPLRRGVACGGAGGGAASAAAAACATDTRASALSATSATVAEIVPRSPPTASYATAIDLRLRSTPAHRGPRAAAASCEGVAAHARPAGSDSCASGPMSSSLRAPSACGVSGPSKLAEHVRVGRRPGRRSNAPK